MQSLINRIPIGFRQKHGVAPLARDNHWLVASRRVINQLIEIGPRFSRIECGNRHPLRTQSVRYYVRFWQ